MPATRRGWQPAQATRAQWPCARCTREGLDCFPYLSARALACFHCAVGGHRRCRIRDTPIGQEAQYMTNHEWEQYGDQVRDQMELQSDVSSEGEWGPRAEERAQNDPVPAYEQPPPYESEEPQEGQEEEPQRGQEEPQGGQEGGEGQDQEVRRERLRLRLEVLRTLVAAVQQQGLRELLEEQMAALESDL